MSTNIQQVWDLEQRLTKALSTHDVHPEDASKITLAYLAAGGPESAGWDDLPADVQKSIAEIEKQPQTAGWDDPMDVPDNLS